MSKLLICGDWHGNHKWAKTMIDVARAEGINKIIQCGDFGVWPGKEGQEYLGILSRYLFKWGICLYFVPGNHEDYNQIDQWEEVLEKNEDGHIEIEPNLFYAGKVNAWEWEGKKFASVGGAVSIDKQWRTKNVSWWSQEQLTIEEEAQAKNLGRVNYLFTHDCPSINPYRHKTDLESSIHQQKMSEVGKALQPDIWFHGHMHSYEEYIFEHRKGAARVFGLDADSQAARYPSLLTHAAVLDTEIDKVSSIDKLFNWYGREFYFDRKHAQDDTILQ